MRRILWWLRRDLRLPDNLVLHQALRDAASVIPVFILDPHLINSPNIAPARKQFLFESLTALDTALRARGSYLILRRGDPARVLVQLARETQADAVYFHIDYTPYARRRDIRVTAALTQAGIPHQTFNDLYLADPRQVLKPDGQPYTVFSHYRARFQAVVSPAARYATRAPLNTPPGLRTLPIPSPRPSPPAIPGGAAAGMKLMRRFIARPDGLDAYATSRNDLAADATSHLSPHLHFGTVSVRELVRMARSADPTSHPPTKTTNTNVQVWLDELIWREFFNQVLFHFPHAARGAFRPRYADLAWRDDKEHFHAWCAGRTGYPLVDAGMRQLNATGWMHNRARMVTASFLTKDLLINWQWGEHYFMQHLIDGDVASNNGGWQWVAGTGTDAQPFFRIFNPTLQARRFDPSGAYIRRWLPELANVPTKYIHAPWTMPASVARTLPLEIGRAYPHPIVDHAAQRARALSLYRRPLHTP